MKLNVGLHCDDADLFHLAQHIDQLLVLVLDLVKPCVSEVISCTLE
jgi:hypothetical protein